MQILQIWQQIEEILQNQAPQLVADFNEGAADDDFEMLKNIVNNDLPVDFVELYKIHNGQRLEQAGGLFNAQQWLPIDIIVEEYQIWQELLEANTFVDLIPDVDEQIISAWWSPKWLPITSDGAGNHFCIDMNPNYKGNFGQVIFIWHDTPRRICVADSLSKWLELFMSDIQNGLYVYDEDIFGFVKKK